MNQEKKMKKGKRSFIKKFLMFLVAVVVLVAGVGYLGLNYLYGRMSDEITEIEESWETESTEGAEKPESAPEKEAFKVDGVKNILLIGNDSRKGGDDGRSDAMILISVNNKMKTIHMTSILRDIYVDIPGRGGNRLNAAYAFGGPQLLMETLEANFGITVNRYMLVNFQAFASVVDAVGGVDIEVTSKEVKYINDYLSEYNRLEKRPSGTDYMDTSLSGVVHLNGPQALAFCRNRYIGTDFARTERQRKVLTAIYEKAPTALLTNAGELMDGLLSNVKTNLKKSELSEMLIQAPMMLGYETVQTSIPLEDTYSNVSIRGMSVLQVDFEPNIEYIQKEIYGN